MGIKFNPFTGQFDLVGTAGGGGTVTNVTATGPLQSTGGITPNISFEDQQANTVLAGPTAGPDAPPDFRALVQDDIPNLSAAKITSGQGSLTTSTSGVTITTGTNALLTNAAVDVQTASGTQNGLLSSTDWTTFNNKQPAGSYITSLTGDVTATGPGAAAATLANTAVTPGSYTLTNLTVDSKGRLTSASNGTAVTSVTAGTGLNVGAGPGGTISTTGTLNLANTAVTPGTFTNATITVDAQGRLTSASTGGTGADWALAGNALTGGTAATPNEFMGSTNTYDVVFRSNNIEGMRLTTLQGLEQGIETTGGSLSASGTASSVRGRADAATSLIQASGTGSVAEGSAVSTATITSTSIGSMSRGSVQSGAAITSTSQGSFARGYGEDAASTISSAGFGSLASGYVQSGSILRTTGNGAHTLGYTVGAGVIMSADGEGCTVLGRASGSGVMTASGNGTLATGNCATGTITSSGTGSQARGRTAGTTPSILASSNGTTAQGSANAGTIQATLTGAVASGSVQTSGVITASGEGSFASGQAISSGVITASVTGSTAMGRSTATSSAINATGIGAFAVGDAEAAGVINAGAGVGAMAQGRATTSGVLTATGVGSLARGSSLGVASDISATGTGTVAQGTVTAAGGVITSTGVASMASGIAGATDNMTVSGDGAHGLGVGHSNAVKGCTIVGAYGSAAGSATTIVTTDPAFVVGSGTSSAARAAGFQIDKDGRATNTAAQLKTAIRLATTPVTVSARTDNCIIADNSAGAVTVNLPAGVNGLEYHIIAAATAAVNNVTINRNGANVFQGGGTSVVLNTVTPKITIRFLTNTWYILQQQV